MRQDHSAKAAYSVRHTGKIGRKSWERIKLPAFLGVVIFDEQGEVIMYYNGTGTHPQPHHQGTHLCLNFWSAFR
ncbi:MAG: hypothetical protein PHQ35_07100 [Phycisphaerae bacterium]|nr:hypothetical protein [Phycisphaerae bacterium]